MHGDFVRRVECDQLPIQRIDLGLLLFLLWRLSLDEESSRRATE